MKSRKSLVLAIALILVIVMAVMYLPENDTSNSGLINASFGNSTGAWALLEVAENDTEREEGLMNRTELGKNEGMLFVFPQEDERTFWMKNTLIPLDIIYLDSEKTVVDVDTAYPEPNTSEENLTRYPSERPAKYVVEVNAGFAENNSIRKGSKVKWGR